MVWLPLGVCVARGPTASARTEIASRPPLYGSLLG